MRSTRPPDFAAQTGPAEPMNSSPCCPACLAGQPVPHGPGDASGGDLIRLLPVVQPPPLWVGGTSLPALRRAGSVFGDGGLSGLQTPREFAASRQRLFELADETGRRRPLTGIGLHAAIGAGPDRDLAAVTAGMIQSMYGVPAARAREVAIGGAPAQVASQLAAYAAAGADLIVVVCDPAPAPRSWELLAEARLLLKQ